VMFGPSRSGRLVWLECVACGFRTAKRVAGRREKAVVDEVIRAWRGLGSERGAVSSEPSEGKHR